MNSKLAFTVSNKQCIKHMSVQIKQSNTRWMYVRKFKTLNTKPLKYLPQTQSHD